MMRQRGWKGAIAIRSAALWGALLSLAFVSSPASAQTPAASTCPAEIENLTQWMLRDLPAYANRVLRRSRILDVPEDDSTFSVMIAGRDEYKPLDLSTIPESQIERIQDPNPPQQVFFTTLEQYFTAQKTYNTQNYHWLFLAKGESGWQPILLFTQFGSSVPGKFPTPPRETSNGIVGQAVKLWLRDCRAGTLR